MYMLSITKGRPVAIVKGGRHHNTIINIDTDTDLRDKNEISEYDYYDMMDKDMSIDELAKNNNNIHKEVYIYDDGKIEPLPDFNNTQRIYISGPTGSGKSYYIRKWLQQYLKVYPKRKIYLFSDMLEDPALDDFKTLIRFHIDDNLIKKKPIRPEKFKNSIVIFDDIDSIQNPKVYKAVLSLQNAILKTGRKLGITCIVTNHLMNNGIKTKEIYNECSIIVFPTRGSNYYALNYALKKYLGMDSKQVKHISKLPTRMCTVFKDYPQFVLYEKGIYLL